MSQDQSHFDVSNLFDVKGKVALVTGGATGIGLMCSQALAVNGAKVYIVGRREERLELSAKKYGSHATGEIIPLPGDITSKDDLKRMADEVEKKEGHLHILVNNAGVAGAPTGRQTVNVAGGPESKFEGKNATEVRDKLLADNDTFQTWEDIYRVNTAAIYFTSAAFLPLLEKSTEKTQGWSGCIINITSISGITKQSQAHFAYNSSKGAAIHVNEMFATELANHKIKIRCNSIAPGVYPSEMTAMGSDETTNKSELPKEMLSNIPAQRPGNERDMASAVLFMATNQYLNGQTVPVDGGWLLVN